MKCYLNSCDNEAHFIVRANRPEVDGVWKLRTCADHTLDLWEEDVIIIGNDEDPDRALPLVTPWPHLTSVVQGR